MVSKVEQIYEGKAKKVFRTNMDSLYIVEYKDDATAFNGQKKGTISGKGVINNQMSNLLFAHLAKNGVPNHFVETMSERETVVRAVTIIPLEVVIRNFAAGSMAKRLGIEEGTQLARPIVEFYLKNDALGDPMVTEDHIDVLELATKEAVTTIRELALDTNRILKAFMEERGVLLIDFKLEFGTTEDSQIILADEISPDTCRFWDAKTREKLDKDRFRRDLGGVEEAYQEMMKRVEGVNAK
jgi:phosphoribosylaminoimidazole-succinocarboxamide synthase